MDTSCSPLKFLAKSRAALILVLGVVTQLLPAPVQGAGKDATLFAGGVITGVIVSDTIRNDRRREHRPRPNWDPYRYDPYRYDPYRHDPYRHDPYRRGRYRYDPYSHDRPRYTPPRYNTFRYELPSRPAVKRPNYDRQEVRRIQAALNTLGYNAGATDGVVGRGTRTAISGFQREIGTKPTGTLTAKQKTMLFDRAGNASQTGTPANQNKQANAPRSTPNGQTQINAPRVKRLTCQDVHDLLVQRGYRRVRSYDCKGKNYKFYGDLGQKQYKITVRSKNGTIKLRRRI